MDSTVHNDDNSQKDFNMLRAVITFLRFSKMKLNA